VVCRRRLFLHLLFEVTMWNSNEIIDDTYMIMGELGRGGTGVIYLAYHLRLEKYVVLKRIKDNFANILKVRTEVDILKKLHHTYLPQVYDFMQMGNHIYTVIDYIDGCDLDRYIKEGYVFTEHQLMTWLRQLCDVLGYLHSQKPQILHCDIKPGNIMITSEGNVCLIDFNISLDEETGSELSGISQYYASPEQYEKAMSIVYHTKTTVTIDQRTDVYSLGATFYHMISGIIPTISGPNTPLSQMGLGYSKEFLEIIDKMMETNKTFRYKNTSEVVRDIDKILRGNSAVVKLVSSLLVTFLVYAIVLVCGFWMYFHGKGMLYLEDFNEKYNDFEISYNSDDYRGAITKGIEILNNVEYRDVFEDDIEKKYTILHYIGECYFYEEDYHEACRYYKETVELGADSSSVNVFMRDYAIALIRTNNISEAQNVIAEARGKGLDEENLKLIDAEIRSMNSDHRGTVTLTTELMHSLDRDISLRAYRLAADSYQKLGEYDSQIGCLNAIVNVDPSIQNYRMIGDAYIKKAEGFHENYISSRKEAYERAVYYYEKVVANEYHNLWDTLNISVSYMELEKYEKAIEHLKNAAAKEENYRIYMYLAFSYEKQNDYANARENCLRAVRLYESSTEKDKHQNTSDVIRNLYLLEQKLR